ncbi:alpha-L-fucosidase [Paenibacillus sp. P3E]|uniref:glycoside hydrolase family 95 protein n=1 Tax=Paenibacillus sp. P3E TaxID=1349435 RepID=UPI00093B0C5A|nr:glycoside hydrolase family 95 protein [Paenibacillus sp. P3E]OKP92560.1 alpha-L-fucosidase [Paenibacillus sp. P3E]
MSDLKLWYSSPAAGWGQGLPIGNGRIGAVVMAAPQREVWSMTEVTYWSGREEAVPGPFGGKEALRRMQGLFMAGDYAEGDRLAKRYLQPEKRNYGTHLGLCEIVFSFESPDRQGEAEKEVERAGNMEARFRRGLDLDRAVAHAESQSGGCTVLREVFASHADDVVAARIWSESPGGVSFTLSAAGGTGSFIVRSVNGDTLEFQAQAREQVHSDGTCGVRAEGRIRVAASGGTLNCRDGRLIVAGADEAWIYFTVSTDYQHAGADLQAQSARSLEQAAAKGYARLRADHIRDYRQEFSKVDVRLGRSEISELPTDRRIALLQQNHSGDPELFALFLQYGRYLMIAGSRADSPLPLHLQGIWNDGEACRMGWSCDYHLDVNTQMNYYPAEIANLGESHLPLMRYIEALSRAGRVTARDFYGSTGWVAHVFSNVWGFTAPGWETSWGLNVTGGLWIAMHLIEHYEYSQDLEFLEGQAYPVLKEAAAFFLDYMIIHPAYGWLVTGPSNSPENSFYPEGHSGENRQLSMGPTMDMVLVRELFEFCLKAAALLNKDEELQAQLEEAIHKLPPLQIGRQGQLQEWLEDYREAQPEHRHLSHLFALYPASRITPEETPELSATARVTLENRMMQDELEDVEFTAALFGLYFARLHDGERAYRHISHLISGLCLDNLLTYSKAGIAGAESNIFVIDGNFGGTAAIAEMLLQSRAGEIHLLPALPADWSTGSVAGLCAKGKVEVDMDWKDGILTTATLRTFSAGTITVRSGEHRSTLLTEAGGSYTLNSQLEQLQVG